MPFDYYQRLKPAEQRVYDQSDRVDRIVLQPSTDYAESVTELRVALDANKRRLTRTASQRIVNLICADVDSKSPQVKVLTVRPSDDYEELHGLYEYGDDEHPVITVWMRTASHRRVVAVRSFLRTLLHELCHHLDFEHLRLADSYHTAGFYKRESSLFKQICRGVDLPRAGAKRTAGASDAKESPIGESENEPANDKPIYIEDNRDWS